MDGFWRAITTGGAQRGDLNPPRGDALHESVQRVGGALDASIMLATWLAVANERSLGPRRAAIEAKALRHALPIHGIVIRWR